MLDRIRKPQSKNSTLLKLLINASLGSLIIRSVGMGFTFAVGVQLARYLGPEGFGIYGIVMSTMAILTVPAQFGVPQLITREFAAYISIGNFARAKGALIWSLITVTCASGLMILGVALFLAKWPLQLDRDFVIAFYWGLVGVPITAVLAVGMGVLRGLHEVVAAQAYDATIRPAFFLAFLVGLGLLHEITPITALALQTIAGLSALVVCLGQLIFVMPKKLFVTGTFDHRKRWGRSSVAMASTELFRVLDGHYAILLLGMIGTMTEIGTFRAAISMATIVGLPLAIVNLVVMPYVAGFHATENRQALQMLAAGSAMAMSLALLCCTFCLYFFGKSVITALFGAEFASAWMPLMLISVAYLVNALFGSGATIMNMCGHEHFLTAIILVGLFAGISATFLLYPVFGISAAAIAILISEIVKGLLTFYITRRFLNINITIFASYGLFKSLIKHPKTKLAAGGT